MGSHIRSLYISLANGDVKGSSSANHVYLIHHQFRADNSLYIVCVQYPFRSVAECRIAV